MRFRYLFINLRAARALHFKVNVSLMATCSVSFSRKQRLFTITVRFMAPTMNGTIQVTAGAPESVNVSTQDNKFVPPLIQVRPGGTVNWQNDGNHEHIVFSAGGSAPNFCLNGRAFVGNTPTVVGDTGERLRWYIFNLDISGVWHNFHPHSVRWTSAGAGRRCVRRTWAEPSGSLCYRY